MSAHDASPPRAAGRPKFLIWRIVGNDLPPRHAAGAALASLQFTLRHETDFPACEKRWLLNRIVDPDVERRLIEALEEHGVAWEREPFDARTYREARVRYEKIRRAIDINGARNRTLGLGRTLARYTIPLDAGCFFSRVAWDALVDTIEGYEQSGADRRYFAVPMMRLGSPDRALDPQLEGEPRDEPQLVFREDSTADFDERYRYGHRDKLELLRRLGKRPGFLRGDREAPHVYSGNEALCPEAGWVLRLPSAVEGEPGGDRLELRERALDAFLRDLDRRVGAEPHDGWAGRAARGVLRGPGGAQGGALPFARVLDGLGGQPGLPVERTAAALWAAAAWGPGDGPVVALPGAGEAAPAALEDGSRHADRGPVTVIPPAESGPGAASDPVQREGPIRLLHIGGARRCAEIQEEFIHWTPRVEAGGLIAVTTRRRERGQASGERFIRDSLNGSREFELVFHEPGLLIVRRTCDARAAG